MIKKLFKCFVYSFILLLVSCQNQIDYSKVYSAINGNKTDGKTYTITYNNVEGLENPNPTTYTVFDDIRLVQVRKSGYAFEGWYETSDFKKSSKVEGWGAYENERNIVLYAKYSVVDVRVDKKSIIFQGTVASPETVTPTIIGIENPVITWSSADEKVATVKNGVITPVAAGNTTITLDVGGITRYIFVIVMHDYADTTYDSGSVSATNGYFTDSANVVSYSFKNGRLDFQGRLASSSNWQMTTYYNGGWTWNVNGNNVSFANGNNTVSVGNVDLTVIPVLAYDSVSNTSFVVIYQILTNTGTTKLTGQKMASHADIELGYNDSAPIMPKSYGARMYDPNTKLAFDMYCLNGDDCTPVDTLWYGRYHERENHLWDGTIYKEHVTNTDTGMCYGWMNIDIDPGKSVVKSIRMTLVECDPNNP